MMTKTGTAALTILAGLSLFALATREAHAGGKGSTKGKGRACTIDGKPFKPAYAKREDSDADFRIFVFGVAPSTDEERKSACNRQAPIPPFATRQEGRVIEIDFNDIEHPKNNVDVTFMTRTEGTSFLHEAAKTQVVDLAGKGASQTIHLKATADDTDCELSLPVVTCPKK